MSWREWEKCREMKLQFNVDTQYSSSLGRLHVDTWLGVEIWWCLSISELIPMNSKGGKDQSVIDVESNRLSEEKDE